MRKKDKFGKLKGKLTKKFYRINQYIQAEKVRVVDEKGKQTGVLALSEALQQAQQKGLDLVEVAPKAQPPVCKIIDFKKFKYLEAKKRQQEKKKSKKFELKEIRLSPFMAQNDFDYKIKRAGKFLKEGHKVKIHLLFRGRQITKKNFGYEVFKKATEHLKAIAKVEFEPKMAGRRLEMTLAPIKGFILKEKKDGQKKIQN